MATIPQILLGSSLGLLVAVAAWRAGSLTNSGAVAAAITGAVIFGLGGIEWAAVLLTFFISSSLLSRSFNNQKKAFDEKFAKGSRRDWGQVLANGGLGVFLVLIQFFFTDQVWVWWAYIGAIAAVNADTWATELGVLSQAPPRLITNWSRVEPGTSGAISLTGILASAAGGALVGTAAGIFMIPAVNFYLVVLVGTVAGLVGSLIDSWLGATQQAIYYCPTCQKQTERHPEHLCGSQTIYQQGWAWLNNDWVNGICSAAGALVSASLWIIFLQ